MTPIPLHLLPSTMTWRAPVEGDFGGEYGPEETTERVRFELADPRTASDYGRHEATTGRIWIDAANSAGGVPPVGSIVRIDGGPEMAVRRVAPYHGSGGRLHHTELEVG